MASRNLLFGRSLNGTAPISCRGQCRRRLRTILLCSAELWGTAIMVTHNSYDVSLSHAQKGNHSGIVFYEVQLIIREEVHFYRCLRPVLVEVKPYYCYCLYRSRAALVDHSVYRWLDRSEVVIPSFAWSNKSISWLFSLSGAFRLYPTIGHPLIL